MNHKVITRNGQPEIVLVPYAEYLKLVEAAKGEKPQKLAPKAVKKTARSVKSRIPEEVSRRLKKGDSPVRAWRLFRDMTQGDLAKAVGVSVTIISFIENGTRPVKQQNLEAISRALDVPLDVLTSVSP